jgi:hypothetical protein
MGVAMTDLIATLEGLTGPSREVDAEIDALLFGGRPSHDFTEECGSARLRKSYGAGTVFLNADPNDNGGHVLLRHYRTAGNYTASLDAATALVKRVLPEWEWSVGSRYDDIREPWGKVRYEPLKSVMEFGATPAIALLIALLRAKEAKDDAR